MPSAGAPAVIQLPYQDILFVESQNAKCILHCRDGQTHVVYKTLNTVEGELGDRRFLRCHQSFLVNMDEILSVDQAFHLSSGGRGAHPPAGAQAHPGQLSGLSGRQERAGAWRSGCPPSSQSDEIPAGIACDIAVFHQIPAVKLVEHRERGPRRGLGQDRPVGPWPVPDIQYPPGHVHHRRAVPARVEKKGCRNTL